MKVIIVGGVAGGASAAARLRRLDEHAQIDVYEKTGYISYANCGLPYYIGDTIIDRNELTLQTPESFLERFNVHMHVHHEVVAIHPDTKTVTVRNLETQEEFEDYYDALVLSMGAHPTKVPMDGMDQDHVFSLRTVEDTFRIKDAIDKNQYRNAVVVGGGFIGIEMAENLHHLNMNVSVVEYADHVMGPFDVDMASFIHKQLLDKGIQLYLKTGVQAIETNQVVFNTGQSIPADIVIVATGVTPDTKLAKEAGLELGIKGSIVVDAQMRTSKPDIYAVGDAVQVKHFVTEKDTLISLAGPANKQGRIVADTICGKDSAYTGSQGSSVIQIFDMTAAATGINETLAKKEGIEYEKVILSPMDHAGYYPGATVMTMKVLFEKQTYRLLGAQIVGYNGVDKRIDVLATAIRLGAKAYELKDLDLAYAPPYASAKDPVNMVGFVAENIKDGVVKQWYLEDIDQLDGPILDTRTDGEYQRGHIEGSLHIPVDDLRQRIDELDKTRPIYVICQSGLRSYIASRILQGYGYDAYNFAGGYRYYASAITPQATACGMEVTK